MEVAFDPAKDKTNRAKHGISLKRAEDFDFDSAFYDLDDSQDYGEIRYKRNWLARCLAPYPYFQSARQSHTRH